MSFMVRSNHIINGEIANANHNNQTGGIEHLVEWGITWPGSFKADFVA